MHAGFGGRLPGKGPSFTQREPGTSPGSRPCSSAHWACRHGRTSWSPKWYACCWRRTTSPGSPTTPTDSAPAGAVTPRCGGGGNLDGNPWFIEGDISDCFGSLDHELMIEILSEKIHDNRFLRLVRNMLKAGYMEDWQYHESLSGTPQGGVVDYPCSVTSTCTNSTSSSKGN